MNWIRRPVFLLCAAALIGTAAPAGADTSAEVARPGSAAVAEAALAQVDQALAATPRDPQLRFRKGVLLAEARRDAEAIAIFTQLNEEYPELAEPYNNLAVLYAGQGNYDKARAALEAAVRGNPAYATAYENLGDVYLRLAARAYERAQALDAGRSALAPKVVQLKTLVPDRPPVAGGKTP
jgi:tetratricopeptide (TPR) repeat protein